MPAGVAVSIASGMRVDVILASPVVMGGEHFACLLYPA
jgi:hypothetical protein